MNRLARIIPGQLKKTQQDVQINYIVKVDPDDMKKIWVLVRNLQTEDTPEWTGGLFLFQLRLPDDFPISPPKFVAYNRNGVYEIDTEAICISIGHYHTENWRPGMGLSGFIREIVNGMMNRKFLIEKGGLGLLSSTSNEIANFSSKSEKVLNEKFPELMADLKEEFMKYSADWDLSSIPEKDKDKVKF